MASLSRALRVAATRPPRSLARCPGLCPLSSGARPTAEKNVPYQRTLKEERGPSAVAQGPSRPLPSTADVVVIGGGSLGCQTLYHLAKLGVSGALLLERGRLTSGTTWHTAAGQGLRRGVPRAEPGGDQDAVPTDERGRPLRDTVRARRRHHRPRRHLLRTGQGCHRPGSTGVWAGAVGRMAGVKVPLVAMHHAYVVTERIEGIQNMPNVRDHDASIYLRLQGDALSVGGYEANPIFWEEVSDKFAFGLFDLDWEVFGQHIEGAINRVPVLEKTGVKSTVCGPESFTPDHKPLMGEAPELRGFFLGCGFNSAGMMLGGGCGQELAHWIVHGRPEKDMYSYDIRRFHCSLTGHRRWIRERSHESYAKNYSIVFPHDEPLAGRSMRTGPLHEELLAQGCVFQERHGWERPGWFTPEGTAPVLPYDYYGAYGNRAHQDHAYGKLLADEHTFDFPPHHDVIKQECLACRGAAAVFDMSYFGKFYLVGLDARKAADWLFSADVSRPPGSTVYTCMLNHRGGTESDLTVSRLAPSPQASPLTPAFEGDGYYLAVGGATAQHNSSYILAVLQDRRFRCQLIDSSEALGLISIQGPASRAILQEVLDADLSNEAFPFSTHKLVTAAGHLVRAMRLSFVGELGWELHIPRLSCVPVYQAVMAAGAKHGLVPAGYRAIDNLSIEKGYRHWHADLRPDDSPLEAGLAFTCKLKSATPFLGREALEKQRAQGLRRRLVCLTVDEKVPVFGLEAIWRDGRVVGHTRRAGFGFAIDKPIAYGYVRDPSGGLVSPDFVKSGDYALERMGVTYPAQAHLKSPFDPDNKRVKGIY
ncbi:sarcosine dehydrogenase, mitochondrial isoform X4 [Pteropus alecto]|uniref:sarcosine dehydrogenase, mitochondrial isoform X4 n=1 Tax=Pteropus alecto TaxID=9402 RepID=UPI0007687CD3|nr:sarcosine dehydrogenase, mitochondrial isoform X4 [Pteropus alecto]